MINHFIINIAQIQDLEKTRQEENDDFYQSLKQLDEGEIDSLVHALNEEVSRGIDCTTCGNCCRSLMINIEPGEPEALASHFNMSLPELQEKFIEVSQQGKMIVNTIPCHFLADNKCTIYPHRFNECREFPHLHKPGFVQRYPGTIMHYGRCPIIFNVIEELKKMLNDTALPKTDRA